MTELAVTKAKARDAYKMGRLASRERALYRLVSFCGAVINSEVRRELAKTAAALLAADGWPLATIINAVTVLGLQPRAAASLAQWAIQKHPGHEGVRL